MATLDDYYTLNQAKGDVEEGKDSGISCPCCGQFVKRYKRKITSAMAYALVLIYKEHLKVNDYIHVESYLKKVDNIPSSIRGDFPKLRFWGLIVKKKGAKDDENPDNGYYRMTEKGIDFVRGKIKIPKYVFIYNNEAEGFDNNKQIDLREAFSNKFDYAKVVYGMEVN